VKIGTGQGTNWNNWDGTKLDRQYINLISKQKIFEDMVDDADHVSSEGTNVDGT
jgi:hypothetical protein